MSAVEDVRMMLRSLWKASGVVWARLREVREVVQHVGVVRRVVKAQEATAPKMVARP